MAFHRSSLATMAQAIYNYLTQNGFDADDIFRRAGMDPARRMDVNHRYSIDESIRMWRIAIHETQHPCLIYEVVDYVEPWMMHAIGHGWIASHNLLAALQRYERYHKMLSTNAVVKLERLQGAWQLEADVVNAVEHPTTDAVLAFTLAMCRKSYGDDLVPLSVQLGRLEPMDASPIENFFRCDIEYGYSTNLMVFNSEDLNRQLSGANPAVAAAMDDVVSEYLERFDASDISNRVRKIVAGTLVHGEPDKNTIAEELAMSPRTLQRRLAEESTSVKQIVDETRHQLSLDYLKQDHLSIKEVAYSLGFNDASNFSRAFKRWENVTPKEFRRG